MENVSLRSLEQRDKIWSRKETPAEIDSLVSNLLISVCVRINYKK